MVNVGFTFLYCVLACLQMYILMGVGILAYYKKILNKHNNKVISSLLINFLIPIYVIVKLSQGVTIEMLQKYWILIINFFVELIVGYLLSLLFHIIFKMDVRIKEAFGAMNMIPALGALPLVIAKGFCFPDGPVEGDPICNDFLSILMLCLLIFNFSVYVISYFLFVIDKNKYSEINSKIEYLWHHVVNKFYKSNVIVSFLMNRYMNKKCNIAEVFDNFEKNHTPIPHLREEIIQYYTEVFDIIENNFNKDKEEEYIERKSNILNNLILPHQKLPYLKSAQINQKIYDYIKEEWISKEAEIKNNDRDFELTIEHIDFTANDILNKLLSPPLISIFFGIILSLSDIRSMIFDNKNNQWFSFMDGFLIITQAYTPLLFGLMGLATITADTDTTELIASRLHVIILLIVRFLILPFIGMFNIWMWVKYYGGIVEKSPAYRLLMFSHWCLPSPSNMTLVISQIHFFANEYGYLILISNVFCFVGLSILNLIYFVLVGL